MSGEALRRELGAEPPSELLDALDAEQLDALAERMREAKRRQSVALAGATEEALGHLPWLVRKTVERVLL